MQASSVEPIGISQRGTLVHRLARAVLAGFVASLAMLLLFLLAYNLARLLTLTPLLAAPWAEMPRQWLSNLTHNRLIDAGLVDIYIAAGAYLLGGLFWALVYALVEPRLAGPAWARGVTFAMIPGILSLGLVLPLLGAGPFGLALGAGPLPTIGNLVLHVAYGAVLGLLYGPLGDLDATTLRRRAPGDAPDAVATYENKAAVFLLGGLLVGVAGGIMAGLAAAPGSLGTALGEPNVAFMLWGGLLGGGLGVLVGSFLGLSAPARHG